MSTATLSMVLVLAALPQENEEPEEARFAPPVRLMAGDVPMGSAQMFPSPTLHDLDGDGVPEMVVGDLFGAVLVSKRLADGDGVRWSAAEPLARADGEELDFSNW